jgi:hypothetical protein
MAKTKKDRASSVPLQDVVRDYYSHQPAVGRKPGHPRLEDIPDLLSRDAPIFSRNWMSINEAIERKLPIFRNPFHAD